MNELEKIEHQLADKCAQCMGRGFFGWSRGRLTRVGVVFVVALVDVIHKFMATYTLSPT